MPNRRYSVSMAYTTSSHTLQDDHSNNTEGDKASNNDSDFHTSAGTQKSAKTLQPPDRISLESDTNGRKLEASGCSINVEHITFTEQCDSIRVVRKMTSNTDTEYDQHQLPIS